MTALAEKADDQTGSSREAISHGWRSWSIAIAVPTALTGLHSMYYGQWIVDDAGLTYASARALATGAGPVLQPGAEPVEAYSNPTWLAVLVVGRWLGLFDRGAWFGTTDIVLFPKLVALLCCAGIFAAMFAICRTVSRRPVELTIIAGGATALVPSFAIWTTSGLENALFALLATAIAAVMATAAARERLLTDRTALTVGVLAALAALTRPDGLVYVAAFPLAAAITLRQDAVRATARAVAVSVVGFTVPVGTYLGWRLAAFGDYLPNPARAKEQGWPTFGDLSKPAALIGYTGWLTVCLAIGAIAIALSRPSQTRTVVVMVLVPLGLAVTSFVVLRPDWMAQYRFATPVWPLAALATTLSAAYLLRNSSTRDRVVAAALAALAAASSLFGFSLADKEFRAAPTAGLCDIAQNTGHHFNGYADIFAMRDGMLLAVDGGGTSMTSRLRFKDLSGLGDRRIARYWHDDDMPGLRDHIFDELRPAFIKMFHAWAERDRLALAGDPRLIRDYELIFSGLPGGGEWVRRDLITDDASLAAARRWGERTWNLMGERYPTGVAPIWRCGDALRPTPFSDRTPAPSPLTK